MKNNHYLEKIRQENPLIHAITNGVTIHDMADSLIAVGASPMMAVERREVAEIQSFSQALVLNTGTNADQQEAHKKLFKGIAERSFDEQIQLITKAFEPSIGVTPYTSQVNVSDSTAISLPLYETEENLPIGTMLWADKGEEYLLLQVARQLEEKDYLKTDIHELDN